MKFLYEDESIIAADKPSGVLVILDRWKKEVGKTLREHVEKKFGKKVYVVHRLDRDTSGVVLFAKTATTHRRLSMAFEKREVSKVCYGLVHGRMKKEEGSIKKPIAPCRWTPGLMIVDKRTGKECITDIKVLKRFNEYSWLEIRPQTGRTHQMRVHLASIGYPLVCDPLYGLLGDEVFLSKIKSRYQKKWGKKEKPLLSRLALHAASIEVEGRTYESPLPKELKATVGQLQKHSPSSPDRVGGRL